MTLYDILDREIKRMIAGIGRHGKGNIHPLVMHEIERFIIHTVLHETNFNFLVAAKILGIGRSTLYRKIKVLNISIPSDVEAE